jgi:hypothetical protein
MMSVALSSEMSAWSIRQPGIFGDVPEDEYHGCPHSISVSGLKRFHQLPAKLFVPRKETSTLRFGSLIHGTILLPEETERTYVVSDLSRNSNAYKELEARCVAEGRPKPIKTSEWDEARYIRDSIMATQIGRDLLTPGTFLPEQSFRWNDWQTGIMCRGRADIVKPSWRVLGDIKSCMDASEDAFAASVSEYAYDWQAIFYEDGFELAQTQSGQGVGHNGEPKWRPELFIFLAVEKEPPYLCHPMDVHPKDLEASRIELRDTLNRFKACKDADVFPAFPDTLTHIRVREWARRQRANVPDYHNPPIPEIVTP